VAGAAVGGRLADDDGVTEWLGVTVWLGVTEWLGVTVWLGVTECDAGGLALLLGEELAGELAVARGKVVGVGERLPAGENEEEGPAEGVDPEHAETAAKASTMPQPTTVNLALRPARAKVGGTFTLPFRQCP
jgi:hypothetical protein